MISLNILLAHTHLLTQLKIKLAHRMEEAIHIWAKILRQNRDELEEKLEISMGELNYFTGNKFQYRTFEIELGLEADLDFLACFFWYFLAQKPRVRIVGSSPDTSARIF